MKTVKGDVTTMDKWDIVIHGCNCFNIQKAGLARKMSYVFDTNNPKVFLLEDDAFFGDKTKLGKIECKESWKANKDILIVNAYTQYNLGNDARLDAVESCFKKLNHALSTTYKGKYKTLGLPKIGCGIGGLKWSDVKALAKKHITAVKIIHVDYDSN